MEKNKLELQIKFMKKKKLLISHTSYEIIDEKNNVLSLKTARDFNNINDLLKSCDIGLSSVIVQKKTFNKRVFICKFKNKRGFCFMA